MRFLAFLVLSAGVAVAASCADASCDADRARVRRLVAEGDSLYRAVDSRAASERYRAAERLCADDPAVLDRLAKVYTAFALTSVNRHDEEWNYPIARRYAERALAADSAAPDAHLALAVYFGWKTFLVGDTRQRVDLSRHMHDEAERALAIDANSDFALNILGQWNREVARLAWYERAAVTVAYGGLPDASYARALELLWRAAGLAPDRLMHKLELAKTYRAMGDRATADSLLGVVVVMPHRDGVDERLRAEARALLSP